MDAKQALLAEFDLEMGKTREILERVPDAQLDWTPHAKSMTLRVLTTHIANLPNWALITMNGDHFDMAPPGQEAPTAEPVQSAAGAIEQFDKNVVAARSALTDAADDAYGEPWNLLHSGKTLLTLPRLSVLRSFVMNHIIHHRAQLGVYLRLLDIPVPPIYGPTADEGGF